MSGGDASGGDRSRPRARWWETGVIYQIYPRSFADGNGDGVGDLAGIRDHLDHLRWLGVDAVWLSPIYRSPMADFGYDVSDHTDVEPVFGDLAELDGLLDDLHGAGMRLVLDFVPNHTSDRHRWFQEAVRSRDSPKRDWYVWRDPPREGGPPNNWMAAFPPATPAWTLDETSGQYYLHLFLPEQPDLNWAHPGVEEAQHAVLRFWLDRGVDGFRLDVVHCIGKDPALPDAPENQAAIPYCALNHQPETHPLLRRLRTLADGYGDRLLVGEIVQLLADRVVEYHGDDDELHLVFNFLPLYERWRPDRWRDRIAEVERLWGDAGAWPTWVLSNHDQPRHRTRYGSDARARAAAVMLLTLRGTPFLYAGEELGLADADVADAAILDPGGRDGCRAPIPWTPEPGHGWGASPWLPFPPDAVARATTVQREDPGSTLHLYRDLLRLRRETTALRSGPLEIVDADDAVVAFRRGGDDQSGEEDRIVAVNFSSEDAPVPADGLGRRVLVASDRAGEGEAIGDHLRPDQAVVLA